ncbi:hypothetical protein JAAARDRAFT_154422 [Jaapia argillacea MUCL 33604]|uniref:tRNA(His) guanylyltransferase n=1 Tax=Jaapia argillacea MUCL 33604 TaxID=933084 RepID=A0A067PWE8_9AGAM|nr:hypothetical protein JAAARDRAFT_154422 [Jaapia argillacea MUCL 33604]
MAGSRFAYVKNFELPDRLLPGTFLVLRVDGHSFHRFSTEHGFSKPNDERALCLMDHAARDVMDEFKDIVLGFGESDEFSFVFRKSTSLYNRRHAKILSTVTSLFTSSYLFRWSTHFPETPLRYPPSFDGRIVLYPSEKEVQDYFAWRQADTHANNLYNTAFWALVQRGNQTTTEAHASLRGTMASQKHELLFSRFGINYNDLPSRYRKGSVLLREEDEASASLPGDDTSNVEQDQEHPCQGIHNANVAAPDEAPRETVPQISKQGDAKRDRKTRVSPTIVKVLHCDIIRADFWLARPDLLSG